MSKQLHFDMADEDSLMRMALVGAERAAQGGNYYIGGALFGPTGDLIARASAAVVSAGEIYHAETQLAVLLRAGRAAGVFGRTERFTLATTLQPCPQCRQICVQQPYLVVLYGAATATSGTELGDLGATFTNTEQVRIDENGGAPVVRAANLTPEVRAQCENHRRLRAPIIAALDTGAAPPMPFTDLLELVELRDPAVLDAIRASQERARRAHRP